MSQGVVITLSHSQLEVERACSGLRMLMLFVAVCVGAAFLIRRPFWEKAAVVLSAPPIAVAANVLRITITGILSDTTSAEADAVHTVVGWLMMPLAVLMIWGEMALLERVFPSPESDQP
jgi:exosortase/archaeosortase family protein